jgi:glutaminyl-tRNA synthetase
MADQIAQQTAALELAGAPAPETVTEPAAAPATDAAATDAAAASAAAPTAAEPTTTAKLQLDEATGEYVSKSELKKRLAKRAKKAAKDAAPPKQPASAAPPRPAKPAAADDEPPVDADAIFKQGFLDEVFRIHPVKPVVTRFPPEPNGYLHIGHAKAIAVNFGFARYHGGKCILRFDDTNPEKEKEEYFVAIQEMVRWLGFEPHRVTYSSDYFQQLYDMAEKLISLDKAYVCHCDEVAIKAQRGDRGAGSKPYRCEHAQQTVDDNMQKFRAMRDGKYAPREAWLRMRQDIESGNPEMWDVAAYRVKTGEPHFRTGWDWKIYATYHFSHCLVDSFEGITHSLCTDEFLFCREEYEWLNKTLGVYEPMQREYGRLNITGTVLSKRKIQRLVTEKIVRGWDDPRLFTLIALKRRGIPPGAILEFVNEVGVTTSKAIIDVRRLEQVVRRYLERTVPRLALVLDPLRVVIEGAEDLELDVPLSPKMPAMGSHKVWLTPTVHIDRSDFREVDSPDYYRLAVGKSVGLLQVPFPIRAKSFTRDPATGAIVEVQAEFDRSGKKPKTYIQWVGGRGARRVEARVYAPLFKLDDPDKNPDGFLADVNEQSETVYPDALVESGIDEVRRRAPWPEAAGESELGKGGPESVRFQALRVAYFAVDKDSTEDKLVLNRIVSLKEDAGKSS